jgi:hypothetical protein
MNIVFIADSTTMLLELDRLLINDVNIIWVVYHESTYKELIKYGVESERVKHIDLRFPFITRPLLIKKILNRAFYFLFKERALEYYFQHVVKNLNKKYNPKFYLTDTSRLISKVDTVSPKATILHSVPYKNFYLSLYNLNYNILFLPGDYHKKRIEKYYSSFNFLQNQLEVIGNLKLSSFVNKKTLSEKFRGKLLESYGLNPKWPLVLYAPTYDAFDGDKFFPDEFKGQYKRLEEYAEFLEKNEFNLIIKFHHYMECNFKSKNMEKIIAKNNTSLFKTIKNHDTLEGGGNDLLMASDIVIGETSGVLTTAIYLDKKIIFIEPGRQFDWSAADIEKKLRPGYVCRTFDDLLGATSDYIIKDEFVKQRAEFNDRVFYNKEINAYSQLRNSILKHIAK